MFNNPKYQKLLHVSLDEIKEFIPRVPESRARGENATIPRICVADSIYNAINASPRLAEAMSFALDHELRIVLHVYYFHPNQEDIISWNQLNELVPDAAVTHESWITTAQKPYRVDYIVDKMLVSHGKDVFQHDITSVIAMNMHRTSFCNNWRFFIEDIMDVKDEDRITKTERKVAALHLPYAKMLIHQPEPIKQLFAKKKNVFY